MGVRPLAASELEAFLPLIADYQRFYGAPDPDDARNGAFFARFVAPSDAGMLLGAFDDALQPAGYACLYWTFSSVAAADVVLLNDLYVTPQHRGRGVAEALIAAAVAVACDRGISRLRWFTALDNRRAQRVYERTGAVRSAWFQYELEAGPDQSTGPGHS